MPGCYVRGENLNLGSHVNTASALAPPTPQPVLSLLLEPGILVLPRGTADHLLWLSVQATQTQVWFLAHPPGTGSVPTVSTATAHPIISRDASGLAG